MNLQIHWARIVWTLAAVASFGAAEAQIDKGDRLPTRAPIVTATIVPDPKLGLGRPLGTPVVMTFENGGNISMHRMRFFNYQRDGDRIELRGPCYSACTLVTGYVPRDMICVAPGAFMAFHAAQTGDVPPQRHYYGTATMYNTWPEPIREWIDAQGGRSKLPGPGEGYWTLYDRDLWAMGYPKCK